MASRIFLLRHAELNEFFRSNFSSMFLMLLLTTFKFKTFIIALLNFFYNTNLNFLYLWLVADSKTLFLKLWFHNMIALILFFNRRFRMIGAQEFNFQ